MSILYHLAALAFAVAFDAFITCGMMDSGNRPFNIAASILLGLYIGASSYLIVEWLLRLEGIT